MSGLFWPALKVRLRREIPFLALALAVFALDQLTKGLVVAALAPGQSFPEGGWVKITYVTNTGAAFGTLRGQTALLTFTAVIAVGVLLFYLWQPPTRSGPLLQGALALVLGGAVGNLADRLRLGHVVDFIDFPRWPEFNVADSSIVLGVVLLALLMALKGESLRG